MAVFQKQKITMKSITPWLIFHFFVIDFHSYVVFNFVQLNKPLLSNGKDNNVMRFKSCTKLLILRMTVSPLFYFFFLIFKIHCIIHLCIFARLISNFFQIFYMYLTFIKCINAQISK